MKMMIQIHIISICIIVLLVVVNVCANCGRPPRDCPIYCANPLIARVYCTSRCQTFIEDVGSSSCVSRQNEVLEITITNWHDYFEQLSSNHYTRDVVRLVDANKKITEMKMDRKNMINLLSKTTQKSSNEDLFQPRNFIQRAYGEKLISYPVASFVLEPTNMVVMTIGDLNSNNCDEWMFEFTSKLNPRLIEADYFRVGSLELPTKIVVSPTVNELFGTKTKVPQPVLDYLLAINVIWRPTTDSANEHEYGIECASKIVLEFSLNDLKFTIPLVELVDRNTKDECRVELTAVPRARYDDDANWIFGIKFLRNFCFAFDYSTDQIGISKRRI
ncbi:hypothetical protein M3Y95_01109300 [Aphelenchoides besseyi]|nr:hypothetical protein M3Y95_01109300 [Aphelenchoides besseyi]